MQIQLSEKCFAEIIKFVHELTGISIAKNRISMVEGRLRKRIAALNLQSYDDYLDLVRKDAPEQIQFTNLITTNETYFFRTPRVWEYIENKFLPNWFSRHPNKTLHIWSAAASSGEEAHSLGIICQNFKDKHPSFNYLIVGTDISQEMIQKCSEGRYTGKSIENFRKNRPDLFKKYMVSVDKEIYQALPEIRSHLRFRPHNLFKSYDNKDHFDLILIRNVLIYFKAEDQEKVLSNMSRALEDNGQIIIGESESLSHISTSFKHIEPLVYAVDETKMAKKAS
jgi:chemotaxis protein methyltransferase CheR